MNQLQDKMKPGDTLLYDTKKFLYWFPLFGILGAAVGGECFIQGNPGFGAIILFGAVYMWFLAFYHRHAGVKPTMLMNDEGILFCNGPDLLLYQDITNIKTGWMIQEGIIFSLQKDAVLPQLKHNRIMALKAIPCAYSSSKFGMKKVFFASAGFRINGKSVSVGNVVEEICNRIELHGARQ